MGVAGFLMGPGVKWGLGGKKTGGEGQHDNDGGRAQPLLDVPSASHRPASRRWVSAQPAGPAARSTRPHPRQASVDHAMDVCT